MSHTCRPSPEATSPLRRAASAHTYALVLTYPICLHLSCFLPEPSLASASQLPPTFFTPSFSYITPQFDGRLFFPHFVSHQRGAAPFSFFGERLKLCFLCFPTLFPLTQCTSTQGAFFVFVTLALRVGKDTKKRPSQAPKTGSHSDFWACEPNISVSQSFTNSDTSSRPPSHFYLLVCYLLSRTQLPFQHFAHKNIISTLLFYLLSTSLPPWV